MNYVQERASRIRAETRCGELESENARLAGQAAATQALLDEAADNLSARGLLDALEGSGDAKWAIGWCERAKALASTGAEAGAVVAAARAWSNTQDRDGSAEEALVLAVRALEANGAQP